MRIADRLLVAASLVAAVSSLALHFGHTPAANATFAPSATDLGPADGVVLNDQKPEKDAKDATTRLRIEGKRLAWDDRATAKAWSLGAVHVDKIMKALLNGKSYSEKRKEFDDEALKQEQDFQKRADDMKAKFGEVTPNSPNAPEAQAEAQKLYEEYNKWREGSIKIREKLYSEQIEQAYRELTAAVDGVAEKEGIDIVMRFMPTADPFQADTVVNAREQVIGRTFLRSPEAIDITADVMKSLGITE